MTEEEKCLKDEKKNSWPHKLYVILTFIPLHIHIIVSCPWEFYTWTRLRKFS